MQVLQYITKHIIRYAIVLTILCLAFALNQNIYAQSNSNTITFANKSGDVGLVKVVGPTEHILTVPDEQSRTVNVAAGDYYILVRYGSNPEEYRYSKGDPFNIKESIKKYSAITITLHKVVDGNYETRPISADVFDSYAINEKGIDKSIVSTVGVNKSPEPIGQNKLKSLLNLDKLSATDIEEIRSLITSGADVNARNRFGGTPLYMASQNGHTEVVKLLLAANADVNAADSTNGVTPLNIASQKGHTEVVELLLAANADVNAASKKGITPLLVASQEGHTEVVELLLAANADVNAARNNGIAPLYIAAEIGHTEVVKLLLAAKADINVAENNGITPLLIASQDGHIKVIKLLLAANADVNAADNNGVTPLWMASQGGHTAIVKLLLAVDADVNAADSTNGVTPLLIASYMGHTGTVKLLLAASADINAASNDGVTALDIASKNGHTEIVRLLKGAGAENR